MLRRWLPASLFVALALALRPGGAVEPVRYRLTFPSFEHHSLRVEAVFPQVGSEPLEVRMSRASPGRYALHDFTKNVSGVRAFDGNGRELGLARTDPYGWRIDGHGGTVRVVYDVYGDRVDGTYLAVDPTHAHINMPAAIMWARGLDDRPATVTFVPPAGRDWRVATQLMAARDRFEFMAPNLQYLMDSPAELGPIAVRVFTVDGPTTVRFAAHHTGTDGELDSFVKDVEKIVREQGRIFGEYPDFEPGHYTFLADYLPWAEPDGMEHRNSTVMTAAGTIRSDRAQLLNTVAHEFFHAWNVERIRPRSLEPFDFDGANASGELWLAEGFTEYYGWLTLSRAGLADLASTLSALGGFASSVVSNGARRVRSAEEMSRMAVLTDGAEPIDRTDWSTTVISYYQFGGAIALALDLSLRERSGGRVTLDDYMRALWRVHGRPGGSRPGYVDRPYTVTDAVARLAEVAGDAAFALEFFARHIQGHEVADYARLLAQAGLVLRRPFDRDPWIGDVQTSTGSRGVRLESDPGRATPLYAAGAGRDDEIVELGTRTTSSVDRLSEALRRLKPGDTVPIVLSDRSGAVRRSTLTVAGNPALQLVARESTGAPLDQAERAFRRAWLGPR